MTDVGSRARGGELETSEPRTRAQKRMRLAAETEQAGRRGGPPPRPSPPPPPLGAGAGGGASTGGQAVRADRDRAPSARDRAAEGSTRKQGETTHAASPPHRPDDKVRRPVRGAATLCTPSCRLQPPGPTQDGHFQFEMGESLDKRCTLPRAPFARVRLFCDGRAFFLTLSDPLAPQTKFLRSWGKARSPDPCAATGWALGAHTPPSFARAPAAPTAPPAASAPRAHWALPGPPPPRPAQASLRRAGRLLRSLRPWGSRST